VDRSGLDTGFVPAARARWAHRLPPYDLIVNQAPDRPRLPVIGLVGGIGAGKSTAARAFEAEGCVVADSDELARQAYNDPEIHAQLLAWWGDRVCKCYSCHAPPDGMPPPIDRRAVAEIMFSSRSERARLESLVHP
jgi:dephospho-CoA kinase